MDSFLDEMKKVKGSLNENQPLRKAPTHEGGGDNNYYRELRYLGGGAFLKIRFRFNKSDCSGSGISSRLQGFTISISWDGWGGSVSSNNNRVSWMVEGTLKYNIFVEGVGTVFEEDYIVSGQVSCN